MARQVDFPRTDNQNNTHGSLQLLQSTPHSPWDSSSQNLVVSDFERRPPGWIDLANCSVSVCLREISQRNENEDSAGTLNDLLNQRKKQIRTKTNTEHCGLKMTERKLILIQRRTTIRIVSVVCLIKNIVHIKFLSTIYTLSPVSFVKNYRDFTFK